MSQSAIPAPLSRHDNEPSTYLVVSPEKEESYWQPKPANGYAAVHVAPHIVPMTVPFSFGTQTLPPGGVVREHSHDRNEEVLHFIAGSGRAILDGVEFRLTAGSTLYLGKLRSHTFINDGDVEMHWTWFYIPAGLENFFRDAGKPRTPGERPPEPFDRPASIAAIEERTGFSKD